MKLTPDIKISYMLYRSFSGKYHSFTFFDTDQKLPLNISSAVEGEEIQYGESYRKIHGMKFTPIGDLKKYTI